MSVVCLILDLQKVHRNVPYILLIYIRIKQCDCKAHIELASRLIGTI